jgi:hypothetical protein
MANKTKVKKPDKMNKVVFEAYQIAINNKMKAGKDVSAMSKRLTHLISEYKHK